MNHCSDALRPSLGGMGDKLTPRTKRPINLKLNHRR